MYGLQFTGPRHLRCPPTILIIWVACILLLLCAVQSDVIDGASLEYHARLILADGATPCSIDIIVIICSAESRCDSIGVVKSDCLSLFELETTVAV